MQSGEPSSKKPRLLWVGDAVVSTGFSRVTHSVLAHLSKTWDVAVIGINHRGDPHPYPYPIYPAHLGGDQLGVGRLVSVVNAFKPDVIVVNNDPWNVSSFLGKVDVPVVGYMPVDALNLKREWCEALNTLACAVWYTEFGKEQAMRSGYTGRSAIIPHGVNADLYQPVPRDQARVLCGFGDLVPAGAYIVGNINRNQYRKRLDLTMAYFAEWVHRYEIDDAYLLLHCRLEDVGWDLRALTEYYGIEDQTLRIDTSKVPGDAVPEESMKVVYSCLDLQVSTTMGEGWGLTQMEGMACGVPQVVPEYSALAEWPRGAVEYVPCSTFAASHNQLNTIGGIADREAFVQALDRLYRDREQRDRLGAAGFSLVREPRFDWAAIAERFDTVLRSVVREPADVRI